MAENTDDKPENKLSAVNADYFPVLREGLVQSSSNFNSFYMWFL